MNISFTKTVLTAILDFDDRENHSMLLRVSSRNVFLRTRSTWISLKINCKRHKQLLFKYCRTIPRINADKVPKLPGMATCLNHLVCRTLLYLCYKCAIFIVLICWRGPGIASSAHSVQGPTKNFSLCSFEGHRDCMGKQLAMMQMFLFGTILLQKFHLKFSPHKKPPSMRGITETVVVVGKFEVCATKRWNQYSNTQFVL